MSNMFEPLTFGPAAPPPSRFIPREQLRDYQPWRPGLLDAPPEPEAPAVPQGPSPEEIAARLQIARDRGYEAARREGEQALEQYKSGQAAELADHIQGVVTRMQQQFDALQQDTAEQLARIALALAREVVRSELAQRPQLVVDVAQEALDTLIASSQDITLRVHPDDHPLVALGAQEQLAARGAQLLADADVERGGCIVESSVAAVDASMASRWRRAAAAMGRHSDWDDETAPTGETA